MTESISSDPVIIASIERIAVDWYSFSIWIPEIVKTDAEFFDHLSTLIEGSMSDEMYDKYFLSAKWESGAFRAPYKRSMANKEKGISIYWGGQQTALVEIQGRGCTNLHRDGALLGIVARFADTSTRLDMAVDFSGVSVREMANSYDNPRIKSRASNVSVSGETEYIGNWKSDRFVRVYEYKLPHDRANEPRIEFVNKKHYAKQAARYLCAYGVNELAQMCQNTFNFERLPSMANISEVLPSATRERSASKKVGWLLKQVAPAVRELMRTGEIDMEFIVENFIPIEIQSSFMEYVNNKNEGDVQ